MSELQTKPINEWLNELPNINTSTSTITVGVEGGQPGKLNSPLFYRVQWNTPNTLLSELTDLYTFVSPNGRHILIELYGYSSALLLFYSSGVENDGTCSVRGTNFYTGKRFDAQNIDPTTLTITELLSDYVVEDSSTSSMPYTSFQCYSSSYTVADLISQLSSEGVTTISGQPVIVSFVGMVSGTFLCRLNNIHDTYYACEFTDLKKLETFYFEGYSASLSLYNSLKSSENKQLSLKDLTENGGGSATDADHIISVTYDELKALRDDASLVPGMFYKITDYVCTTSQENTRATDHRFNIIVQALNIDRLSEIAKADYNSDDDYFRDNNANLPAWEIKYCLDNDTTRFAWAKEFYQEITNINTQPSEEMGCYLTRQPQFDGSLNGTDYENYYYAWGVGIENQPDMECVFTENEIISNGDTVANAYFGYFSTNAEVIEHEAGKGVIYYMKDEHGNECPYDFKNIQFLRMVSLEDGYPKLDEENGEETWVYTFCGNSYHFMNDEWSELKDGSLESPYMHQSDEGAFTFTNNIIKPYHMIYDNDEDVTKCGKQYLNNNVFLGWWTEVGSDDTEDGYTYHCPYCCAFINLDYNCYDNTFEWPSTSIKVGNNTHDNYIQGSYIEIGSGCTWNTIISSCLKMGNSCVSNQIYSGSTTLDDECWGNILTGYNLVLLRGVYNIDTTDEYPANKIYKGEFEIV